MYLARISRLLVLGLIAGYIQVSVFSWATPIVSFLISCILNIGWWICTSSIWISFSIHHPWHVIQRTFLGNVMRVSFSQTHWPSRIKRVYELCLLNSFQQHQRATVTVGNRLTCEVLRRPSVGPFPGGAAESPCSTHLWCCYFFASLFLHFTFFRFSSLLHCRIFEFHFQTSKIVVASKIGRYLVVSFIAKSTGMKVQLVTTHFLLSIISKRKIWIDWL